MCRTRTLQPWPPKQTFEELAAHVGIAYLKSRDSLKIRTDILFQTDAVKTYFPDVRGGAFPDGNCRAYIVFGGRWGCLFGQPGS